MFPVTQCVFFSTYVIKKNFKLIEVYKGVSRMWENAYFSIENSQASRALQRIASFTCMTPHDITMSATSDHQSWAPLSKILDPHLSSASVNPATFTSLVHLSDYLMFTLSGKLWSPQHTYCAILPKSHNKAFLCNQHCVSFPLEVEFEFTT